MKTSNNDTDHRTVILGIVVFLLAVSMCAGQGTEASNLFSLDNRGMTAYAGTLPPGETVIPESRVVALGNVVIPSGSRLMVQKDTILKLDGSTTTITVDGELVVQGTSNNPVIFTSFKDDTGGDTNDDGQASSPAPGNWQGIVVGPNGKLTLENAEIRYAVNGIITSGQNTSIIIDKSKILNCQQYGIWIAHQGCQFESKTSLIAKNGSGGVYLSSDSFLRPKRLTRCTIVDNTGPGIYFTGCKLDINSSIVAFNRNGVTCGSSATSELGIQYSNLYNPGWSNVSGITYNLNDDGNILSDPLFFNRTESDYNLAANSPAIDSSSSAGTETDILSRSLYDDKGVANTGRGGCWFGDMGAFERQEDSYSVDLVASHIFSLRDPIVTSGQTIDLNWTVGNQGNLDAVGTWTDKLYLSKDGYLGADDILIGQAQITGGLAAGEYYEESLSVIVPQIQGINYLLLVVDTDKECDTVFRSNNVALSVRPVLIDLPVIDPASGLVDTISNKSWNYYLFNNPSAHNVKVSFQTHSTNTLGVYAIESAIPDVERFEYNSVSVGGVASLIIPADTNDLIVGVYGEKVSVAPSPLDISVDDAAMTIQSVLPNRIGNAGNATLHLVGESLSPDYEFSLDNGQGHTINAVVMPDVSDWMGAVFLEFDMTGTPQGDYVLSVIDSEGLQANYGQPITVVNSDGTPKFKGTVLLPGMARPLFVSNVTVTYENNGLNDLYSPMLTLVGPQGAQWQLPGEDSWLESDKCQLMALSSSGWANVLRPGQKESIYVKMRVPSTYTAEWLNVQLFSKGLHENDGSARVQDWVYEVTNPEIAATLEAAYGRTQGDYIKLLGQAAAGLSIYGNLVYSPENLSPFMPSFELSEHPINEYPENPIEQPASGDGRIYDYKETTLYEWNGSKWVVPDASKIFTGSTAILIHGWNATLDTVQWEWPYKEIFRDMAIALGKRQVDNVLGIGWKSYSGGVTPEMLENLNSSPIPQNLLTYINAVISARRIPGVVDDAFRLLCSIDSTTGLRKFRIDPSKTHIIGHSHGAHVAGLLGNKFVYPRINRITALDASSEHTHLYAGNLSGTGWGQGSAAFTDYYKGSILASGTKPWGINNFIVVPWDVFRYDQCYIQIPDWKSIDNYKGSHGYPIIWFIHTIEDSTIPFGYNWRFPVAGVSPSMNTIPQLEISQHYQPWIGMIRGNINVEGWHGLETDALIGISIADGRLGGQKSYSAEERWTYSGFWDTYGWGAKQGGIEDDLRRIVEFECKSMSLKPDKSHWAPGENSQVTFKVVNYADNTQFKKDNLIKAQTEIRSNLYLSLDENLNIKEDICLYSDFDLGSLEYTFYHTKNDFVEGRGGSNTITKTFQLPSKDAIKKAFRLTGGVDGTYYLILDLCSTQSSKNYELYPSDNVSSVPIRIDEDSFYADMGFKELTLILEEGQSSVSHMLSGKTSHHPSKNLDNESLHWQWHINGQLIGNTMELSAVLEEGRHEIVLTLVDTEIEEESKDWGVITVKQKDKEGDKEDDERTRTRYPIDPEDKFGPAGYDNPETSES